MPALVPRTTAGFGLRPQRRLSGAVAALLLACGGCDWLETQESTIASRGTWERAPSFVPPSATDIRHAGNVDVWCRQWIRFRFAPADSAAVARAGTPVGGTELGRLPVDAPTRLRWWAPPAPRTGATFRITDGTLSGTLLVRWDAREAYFRGC